MLGFHAVSAAPFSASAKTIHRGAVSLSVTATYEPVFSRLGVANLGAGAFSLGFDLGYDVGSSLFGTGTIVQFFLPATATFIADGVVEKPGIISLASAASMSAGLQMQMAASTLLQTVGSLDGNSVLLHGGAINLSSLAAIQAELKNSFANADQVKITLYLDRIKELSAYMDTTRGFTSYIDKQRAVTLNVDEILSHSSYIDKQRNFELAREK